MTAPATNLHYPVKLELRIDWSDIDSFGHVNNISIFRYIQSSRVEYLTKCGFTVLHIETGTGPILASCKCDFRRPLFFPGQIIVHSRVNFIKTTSFGIIHRIVDEQNQLSAEAQDIIVVYDFDRNKKVMIPQGIREQIEQLESRTF